MFRRALIAALIASCTPLPPLAWRIADWASAPEASWPYHLVGLDLPLALGSARQGVIVAVIDSGVDPGHPDLVDHLLPSLDVWQPIRGDDRLINGHTVHDYTGRDGNGHGTHVTGILVQALAQSPPGLIKVLPIKATNHLGETDTQVLVQAIQAAIGAGAKVLNISLDGPANTGEHPTLTAAIAKAAAQGVVVVAATGNQSDRQRGSIAPVGLPAAIPGVIGVSATTRDDRVADYANGGPETTLTAPGGGSQRDQQILAAWPTYPTFAGIQHQITRPEARLSGTSMATPLVSATAALLLAQEPWLTPRQVRLRLIATADDLAPPGHDPDSGWGRLNSGRALTRGGHHGP